MPNVCVLTIILLYTANSSLCRDGKRQAEAVDEAETSEAKKPKLDTADVQPEGDEDDTMIDESEATTPANESAPAEPLEAAPVSKPDAKGKAKAKQGSDVHFKENPFTFISPGDPIVQACV